MSDSDGSPQRDDRHHRRSGSRSPVSPGCAGGTFAEREERQLAEAAVPVRPPAGQAGGAPTDPEPAAQEPALTEETAPAAQATNPADLPAEGAPGAQGGEIAAPAGRATAPTDHAAAPSTLPAQGVAPAWAPNALLGAAGAAAGGREGAKYRAHTKPRHTYTKLQAVPPQGRVP